MWDQDYQDCYKNQKKKTLDCKILNKIKDILENLRFFCGIFGFYLQSVYIISRVTCLIHNGTL